MSKLIYPESPVGIDSRATEPSPEFKKNVASVVGYIVLFALVYVVLLLAGLALAVLCGAAGISIVTNIHNFMAILFGLGLLGIAVMVCYFLVKFLFASKKEDDSKRIEITEDEYPLLFEFIRKLSAETGTQFPKHIYIIPDVNASVSYESNIKSLLFPVRKNLSIGLGLVNMTNLSEFKAVLAHEFGHFSQESMRAGSYVYHANKVIYNMLYENTGYDAALTKWASIHSIFALCANITVKIVQGIQWVLQQVYSLMNKAYMSLSRQMEFHADAVGATVAGGNNCIHALRRVEFADSAYSHAIGKYNAKVREQYKGVNVYSHQRISAAFIAEANDVPHMHGLPELHQMDKYIISYRRINLEDQWASHPTRQQREEALNALNITGAVCDESPWVLFGDNAQKLQEILTDHLYANISFENDPQPIDDKAFAELVDADKGKYDFPDVYKGYYDNRRISEMDITDIKPKAIPDIEGFFEKHKDINRKIQAIQEDINSLEYAADEKNKVRYFDLDGQKLYRDKAATVKQTFEKQLTEMQAELAANDAAVYAHYLAASAEADYSGKLTSLYNAYASALDWTSGQVKEAEQFLEEMRRAYHESFTIESAKALRESILSHASAMSRRIKDSRLVLGSNTLLAGEDVPEDLGQIDWARFRYFEEPQLLMPEFDETWEHVVSALQWYYELNFKAQKNLLELQISLQAEVVA